MRADILTANQWTFLHRYAVGHKTTLADIARYLLQTTAPKAAKGSDRKLIQDRARCAAAIGILERWKPQPYETHPCHAQSIALELKRMRRAYDDPALLWTIYRRADRATGYVLPIAAAVPARRKAA